MKEVNKGRTMHFAVRDVVENEGNNEDLPSTGLSLLHISSPKGSPSSIGLKNDSKATILSPFPLKLNQVRSGHFNVTEFERVSFLLDLPNNKF
jgi:hypothetical protein